jgi:hypothetical protein
MVFMDGRAYAIDRIEGELALCECLQTGEAITVPVTLLPTGAKEGDILRQADGALAIDEALTEERLRKLTERMKRLFDRHK